MTPGSSKGPRVVALGGGHGLAMALRAIRTYTDEITAVVTVADDGGSSGRLRQALGVAPPGDLRNCLVALAEPGNPWVGVFDYRFDAGELDGHSLGNLVLVGLERTSGGLIAALDEAGRILGATGRVRPATTERVVLKAQIDSDSRAQAGGARGQAVEGQVAVANATGRIRRVELVPGDAPAHPDVLESLAAADQVILAPGSLYTSLLPVLAVPELRAAVQATPGCVVQVCNLSPEVPETAGLDAVDHLQAVLEHGGRVDVFLVPEAGGLPCDPAMVRTMGVEPVLAEMGPAGGPMHDPERLARALSDLLESRW